MAQSVMTVTLVVEEAARVLVKDYGEVMRDLADRNAALQLRVAALEQAIVADVQEGRSQVDQALAEYGYDSLRFADVRHGWLFTTRRIGALVPAAHAPSAPADGIVSEAYGRIVDKVRGGMLCGHPIIVSDPVAMVVAAYSMGLDEGRKSGPPSESET